MNKLKILFCSILCLTILGCSNSKLNQHPSINYNDSFFEDSFIIHEYGTEPCTNCHDLNDSKFRNSLSYHQYIIKFTKQRAYLMMRLVKND